MTSSSDVDLLIEFLPVGVGLQFYPMRRKAPSFSYGDISRPILS